MPDPAYLFRDRLTIDQDLNDRMIGSGARTLVIGAREVELRALSPMVSYVIVADHLDVAPHPAATRFVALNVTLLAKTISGALDITCPGSEGPQGAPGEPGESGTDLPVDARTGKPAAKPTTGNLTAKPRRPAIEPIDPDGPGGPLGPGNRGGPGGPGSPGEDGGAGGTLTIHYASATDVPTGSAPGGAGGRGGAGGAGGAGRPPGRPGRSGKPGRAGPPGVVEIKALPVADVMTALDDTSATAWAAYRAEVAAYLFRKFDPESQQAALIEAMAALELDPSNAQAAITRDAIVNRQVPSGLARDLDIAADFPDLAANLVAEIAVVQGAFSAYQQQLSLLALAESVRTTLGTMKGQLKHRQQEAGADVVLAQQDVDIARAEKANLQAQIDQVRQEIVAAQDRSFGIGDLISTVGAVAVAVAGIAGVGALFSIPAGIAALQSVGGNESSLLMVLGVLQNKPNDPKHPTSYEYDILNANKLFGDLKDLMTGAKSAVSFVKIIGDLDLAASRADQADVARLLKQQAILTRQQMVAGLREKQARSRVVAATLRASNLGADIVDIEQRLAAWQATQVVVAAATEILVRAARHLVDLVMDDVFLAQRAREIVELDGLPGLRFDYGWLHPDHDHTLDPIERGSAIAASLVELPLQVLSWMQIYQRLNVAQIGFDVIHPGLSLTITDPAQLSAFAAGSALAFSVDLADLPARMFEFKLDALEVELRGASTAHSANVWITHSGEWRMKRRTDGSTNASITAITLRARSDVLVMRAGSGTLAARLPAHPQSSAEKGAPFPFWGRGVATTFELRLAQQPSPMDLTQLSAIHVRISGLAFAPQGAGSQPGVVEIRPDVRLLAPPAAATITPPTLAADHGVAVLSM